MNNMRCEPILPLVFVDSLSYYEQLCHMSKKINEIITALDGDVSKEIQNYIDTRFNNFMLKAIYDEKTETIYLKKGDMNNG